MPLLLRSDGFLAEVNAHLRHTLGAGSASFMVARFACIVPILLVPTVLMGSTLPLLARHFVAQHSSAGRASEDVGRLYAVNTFGAVAGVVSSCFVLLPRVGVSAANTFAACTNFALAALVLGLWWWQGRSSSAGPVPEHSLASSTPESEASAELPFPTPVRRAAAVAFALSGFASLLYEVVWSRALVNTIGGSLYSFALILTTFLLGIGGGSALFSSLGATSSAPLRASALTAGFTCLVASGPFASKAGLSTASLIACASLLGIVITCLRAAGQAKRARLFDEQAARRAEVRASASLFVLPSLLSLLSLVRYADRLSRIAAATVWMSALLALLLLALRTRPLLLLASLQLFLGGSTFVANLFADELSLTFASMVAPLYYDLPDHVGTVQALMLVTAALCVLPSALAMGAVFPATMRVYCAGGARIGHDVGLVYAGNTVGSILGAFLPGFVLMPRIGMQATLHVGIVVNLLLALLLVLVFAHATRPCASRPGFAQVAPRQRYAFSLIAAVVPWLVCGLVFVTLRPQEGLAWNISKMTLGAFRISLARDVLDEESWGEPQLVYYRDGLATTVTVERWGRHLSLKNNGKVDASNGDDMPTQIMVSALPLLLHPRGPEDLEVAIVGFGSGVTVGAALQFPVRSVEVAELEGATIEASRFFADVNHLDYVSPRFPYVRMPRLTVVEDDGRNYLAASRKRYDVIVSEPSNPWLTGVSDLFTFDHFRISKAKLKPGGIYCQWAQLYELSPENVKSLYRTFASQFAHVLVFSAEDLSSDTILVGSDAPLSLDLSRVQRAMRNPKVAAELERAYIHSPFDVFARVLLASKEEVLRFTEGAELNTDDNARIELAAPRDLIGFERYKGYLETMYTAQWPYGEISEHLAGFGSGLDASERYAEQALSLLSHGRKRQAERLLARAAAEGPSPTHALVSRIHAALARGEGAPRAQLSRAIIAETPERLRVLLTQVDAIVEAALEAGNYMRARTALEQVPASLRRVLDDDFRYLEAYLAHQTGEHEQAIEIYEELVRRSAELVLQRPELRYFLARSHDALLHFDKAVRNMRVFVEWELREQAQLTAQDGHPGEPQRAGDDAPDVAAAAHADRAQAGMP